MLCFLSIIKRFEELTHFIFVFVFIKGDVKFAEVLEKMGAEVSWTENSVTVKGPPRAPGGRKHLRAIDVNMNKMPDVAMTLAVVALFADGPTAIRDGMLYLLSLQSHIETFPFNLTITCSFLALESSQYPSFIGILECAFIYLLQLHNFIMLDILLI